MNDAKRDSLPAELLAYLQNAVGEDALSYSEAPAPITGGFDTAIYGFRLAVADGPFAGPLILRVFRDGGVVQARYEAAVQNAVSGQGFPTPRILLVCEDTSILGGAFAVMPRVSGVPMLDKILSPAIMRMPGTLARLHASLHSLDPEPVRIAVEAAGLADRVGATFESAWGEAIDSAKLDGLRSAYEWLMANRPQSQSAVVCHGDLHPLNVMMEGRVVSGLLDWPNARIDDPAWDVGATVALMGHGPVDLPGPVIPIVNAARRWLVRHYLKEYLALLPIDRNAIEYYEATRLLGFLIEVGTVWHARAGVIAPVTKPTAFESPRVVAGIVQRFAAITGVRSTLPAAPLLSPPLPAAP